MSSTSQPVAKQIKAVSSSLIIGLLVLALTALATTFLMKSTFQEYRVTARTTLTSNTVFQDIFGAQLAAAKWRLAPDQRQVDAFRASIEDLKGAEAELVELVGDNAELAEVFSNLEAEIAEYSAQFDATLAAQAQFDATKQQTDAAGLSAREALTEVMTSAFNDNAPLAAAYAGRAQEALMLGRYYLERYRRTEAPEDLERSQQEMRNSRGGLMVLLPQLRDTTRKERAGAAVKDIQTFIDGKEVMVSAIAAQMEARARLDTLGPKIMADVAAVIEATTARQNTLGPRGQSIAFWAMVSVCLVAATTIILGWRISGRMAARMSADIEQSVTTMTRIADGDLETPVPNTELDNEIGRMAKALEVFKSNGKASIEAAEREKAAEEQRAKEAEELKRTQEEQEVAARAQADNARKEMIGNLSASLGQVVSAASAGDFSHRVDANFDDPALAALGQDVNTLVESVEYGLAATGGTLARVAEGDLTREMEGDFSGAFNELQTNTNGMIAGLRKLISEITQSGSNLSSSAGELKGTSEVLSRQAEQNAASLEETSAALEQLTASIKQVSENVTDANEDARTVSDTAKSSSVVAAAAAEAMNRISDASGEIARVVGVIDDISFQINLLALNAGVEAARAGDAGRGFSVVASEVRQLAQRAADSAREISEVIGKSELAVKEGVTKVSDAQGSLERIAESVVGVSERIDQVSSAISEQVNGISEINKAVNQIDQNTQQQTASFEEVTATSALLSNEADGLHLSTSRFVTVGTPGARAPMQPEAPLRAAS